MTPVTLTRCNLTGQTFRIGRVYGPTIIGIRVYLAYHAAKGCRDSLMTQALANALAKNLAPFANVNGQPCSLKYYARKALTQRECERRECNGRAERALEQVEQNERRRA